jgi:hypothetical protein
VNKAIEDEYGDDFKAEIQNSSLNNRRNMDQGKNHKGKHMKNDVSDTTHSLANESINHQRELQLDSARDDLNSIQEDGNEDHS